MWFIFSIFAANLWGISTDIISGDIKEEEPGRPTVDAEIWKCGLYFHYLQLTYAVHISFWRIVKW